MKVDEQLKQLITQGNLSTALELALQTKKINIEISTGGTLLHLAAMKGTPHDISRLIDAGANLLQMTHGRQETAYDLAVRLEKNENAFALRNPTLKAIIIYTGKTFFCTVIALKTGLWAGSFWGKETFILHLAKVINAECMAYAVVSGKEFLSTLATRGALVFVSEGPVLMLKEIGNHVITRKASAIGYEQAGPSGAILSMALINVLLMGWHRLHEGHWVTPLRLAGATTLVCANLLGIVVGQEFGVWVATKRLGELNDRRADDADIIKSYQVLGGVVGAIYARHLLAEKCTALITHRLNEHSLITKLPLLPAMSATLAGGVVGAYSTHKTNTNLLPITGSLVGAMVSSTLFFLFFGSLGGSEENDIPLLPAPEENSGYVSNILMSLVHFVMHGIAIGVVTQVIKKHHYADRCKEMVMKDIKWFVNTARETCQQMMEIQVLKAFRM